MISFEINLNVFIIFGYDTKILRGMRTKIKKHLRKISIYNKSSDLQDNIKHTFVISHLYCYKGLFQNVTLKSLLCLHEIIVLIYVHR